jgi:hypothetical protein
MSRREGLGLDNRFTRCPRSAYDAGASRDRRRSGENAERGRALGRSFSFGVANRFGLAMAAHEHRVGTVQGVPGLGEQFFGHPMELYLAPGTPPVGLL